MNSFEYIILSPQVSEGIVTINRQLTVELIVDQRKKFEFVFGFEIIFFPLETMKINYKSMQTILRRRS